MLVPKVQKYIQIYTNKTLPFSSCPVTQQQQNIIIRTMIRIKSNDKDTASRAMAQAGKEAPALSTLPVRWKGERKIVFSGVATVQGT